MAVKSCRECGRRVSRNARKCQHCGAVLKKAVPLWLVPTILAVAILVGASLYLLYKKKPAESPKPPTPPQLSEQTLPPPQNPKVLELLSRKCGNENKNIYIVGEIKNISTESLGNVLAVAEFRKKDDSLVKSAETLIEVNPLSPGQTSHFKVGGADDPAIADCLISFKSKSGKQLNYVSPKDKQNDEQQTIEVQSLLSALGYQIGEVDGILGNQTITAIKEFQGKHGLPQDGKITGQLLAELRKEKTKRKD